MEKIINIELRKTILECALEIEYSVTRLLMTYLNVETENLKALGNKNSSISFKSKIDLLTDIEVISKEEHAKFLLLMEFRNQFLHNIDCSSFTKAIELLGQDKGKKLFLHYDSDNTIDLEKQYEIAFKKLYIHCLDIILTKYTARKENIEVKRKIVTDLADYSKYIIEKDTELFMTILDKCELSIKELIEKNELTKFKMDLFTLITIFLTSSANNEEFIALKERINVTDKKLKIYFK